MYDKKADILTFNHPRFNRNTYYYFRRNEWTKKFLSEPPVETSFKITLPLVITYDENKLGAINGEEVLLFKSCIKEIQKFYKKELKQSKKMLKAQKK